jgi:hypothetical protein
VARATEQVRRQVATFGDKSLRSIADFDSVDAAATAAQL